MGARGALLFARYAYPPNELGYCGPAGAATMLDADATAEIERRARQFDGAWAYLEYIAESAGIADPLDARVVEAYWIGSDLLGRVDRAGLVRRLADRFRGQVGGTWREAADRAVAHHSFQVYEVYPWAGLLGPSGNPTALSILDRCRIRTGTVTAVGPSTATVTSRPLVWSGDRPVVGEPVAEQVRWAVDGRSLLDGLSPGDRVALHWDWLCDVITADQAAEIDSRAATLPPGFAGP